MFEGFENWHIETSGTTINVVKGGNGPPVLLLHGHPQTHVMWHKIAPHLAQDLRWWCRTLGGTATAASPKGTPNT